MASTRTIFPPRAIYHFVFVFVVLSTSYVHHAAGLTIEASAIAPIAARDDYQVLERRATFSGLKMSYYDPTPAPGSCGQQFGFYDQVVALADETMNKGYCGKKINIYWKGQTFPATIVDTCLKCNGYELDIAEGYFKSSNMDVAAGSIIADWDFVDAVPQQPLPQPQPQAQPQPLPQPRSQPQSQPQLQPQPQSQPRHHRYRQF